MKRYYKFFYNIDFKRWIVGVRYEFYNGQRTYYEEWNMLNIYILCVKLAFGYVDQCAYKT